MERKWHRALVTGASSGIGREMALQLASAGTKLVVVARDQQRLDQLAAEVGVPTEVIVADLSGTSGLSAVADRLADDDHPIDLLVNNAGLGFGGGFIDVPDDKRRLVVDVNVSALQELCHAAATAMIRRGKGTILNVSSIAGDLPGPSSATYNASKAFVTSLSESLHLELKPHNVVVSCLCPGLTRTDFQKRADVDVSDLPDMVWQSAADVARSGLEGAAKGKAVVISGAVNKVASRLARSAPRPVTRWVAARGGSR